MRKNTILLFAIISIYSLSVTFAQDSRIKGIDYFDGLIPYYSTNKWGLANINGDVIVNPKYNSIDVFKSIYRGSNFQYTTAVNDDSVHLYTSTIGQNLNDEYTFMLDHGSDKWPKGGYSICDLDVYVLIKHIASNKYGVYSISSGDIVIKPQYDTISAISYFTEGILMKMSDTKTYDFFNTCTKKMESTSIERIFALGAKDGSSNIGVKISGSIDIYRVNKYDWTLSKVYVLVEDLKLYTDIWSRNVTMFTDWSHIRDEVNYRRSKIDLKLELPNDSTLVHIDFRGRVWNDRKKLFNVELKLVQESNYFKLVNSDFLEYMPNKFVSCYYFKRDNILLLEDSDSNEYLIDITNSFGAIEIGNIKLLKSVYLDDFYGKRNKFYIFDKSSVEIFINENGTKYFSQE